MNRRTIVGRAKLGPGGQHVNDGSESSMVLVIDDDAGLGVYCHADRSMRKNTVQAEALLVHLLTPGGALAEVARLRTALAEAADLAEEGIGYTGDYFVTKWEMRERLAVVRAALGPPA